MTMAKTSILSFIATAIKLLSALVINKTVAVYIGPSGLALIGQFQNFVQFAMTNAKAGINGGITKYTAEYGVDNPKTPILLGTATKISLVSSAVVGALIILFSQYGSLYVLKTDQYGYVFTIFGFTVVLFVLNNVLLSALNGFKEIRTFITINIIQSIYGLIFTALLIVWLGLAGALIALVTNQSVIFLVVLWLLKKHDLVQLKNFKSGFDKSEAKKLASFSLMAMVSALTVPASFFIVRNYIGESLGWEKAGYWQAIWYISSMSLMIVTTTLKVYYLPRLSELTDKTSLRNEIKQGYIILVPIVFIVSLVIFLFKDLIISLLFTEDFRGMRELFLWQLVGGFIKILAFLLSYLMLAKAMTKVFVSTEIVFSMSFVALGIFLVDQYGLVGMTYAFALNYILYLIAVVILTWRQLH